MSRNYDNWERLVDATLKREQYYELCFAHSRSPSVSSLASSSASDFSSFPSPASIIDFQPSSSVKDLFQQAPTNNAAQPLLKKSNKYKFNFPFSFKPSFRNRKSSDQSSDNKVVEFQLSASSVVKIQKGDITTWSVDGSSDAIVNPSNEWMLKGFGVDRAIHRAAGPELQVACYNVPQVSPGVRCPKGEARITPGFRLPASRVIHTVGPIYGRDKTPEETLRHAYRNSLHLAKQNEIQYIAFVAVSCGVYGYPYDEAASVAISTVMEFGKDFKEVHFVLFFDEIYDAWLNKANELLLQN